jgi:serine/threonine protein kinase
MHRDIKPANIMLTRRAGVGDFAKLLDFGLVKAQDSRQQTMLTAADSITGTPLYMSPESIQDPDRADSRSDLYSLGAVAFFLLTGRPVFTASTVLDIIRHHVETPPVAPSQVARTTICEPLDRLVLSCLSKSPNERPASATALIETLEQMTCAQDWTAADAERWWAPILSGTDTATAFTQDINLSPTIGVEEPPMPA